MPAIQGPGNTSAGHGPLVGRAFIHTPGGMPPNELMLRWANAHHDYATIGCGLPTEDYAFLDGQIRASLDAGAEDPTSEGATQLNRLVGLYRSRLVLRDWGQQTDAAITLILRANAVRAEEERRRDREGYERELRRQKDGQ